MSKRITQIQTNATEERLRKQIPTLKSGETFECIDMLPEDMTMTNRLLLLKLVRANVCPDAILCQRQTDGTDFPPFWTIESKAYFERVNLEGEFKLIDTAE